MPRVSFSTGVLVRPLASRAPVQPAAAGAPNRNGTSAIDRRTSLLATAAPSRVGTTPMAAAAGTSHGLSGSTSMAPPTRLRPAPRTRLSANSVSVGRNLNRRALQAPPRMPTVSPPTSRAYFSFGLCDPLPDQTVSPASAPQAVLLANQSACAASGRTPKRVSPQAVPPPITAPALPSRVTTPTPFCCASSDSPAPHRPPAAIEVVMASAVPSRSTQGRAGARGRGCDSSTADERRRAVGARARDPGPFGDFTA